MQFVWYLALIIFCTKIAGHMSARIGQPAVLGKLMVGTLCWGLLCLDGLIIMNLYIISLK